MSVWMELRCEKQNEDCAKEIHNPYPQPNSLCWSHVNEGLGDMARATQSDIIETYKMISINAENCGWKRIDGEWVCPHCVEQLQRIKDGE